MVSCAPGNAVTRLGIVPEQEETVMADRGLCVVDREKVVAVSGTM